MLEKGKLEKGMTSNKQIGADFQLIVSDKHPHIYARIGSVREITSEHWTGDYSFHRRCVDYQICMLMLALTNRELPQLQRWMGVRNPSESREYAMHKYDARESRDSNGISAENHC